jgi:hypothetical protein
MTGDLADRAFARRVMQVCPACFTWPVARGSVGIQRTQGGDDAGEN